MYPFDNKTYVRSYLSTYLADGRCSKNTASCYRDVLLVFDGCVHFLPYLFFSPSLFCVDSGADSGYRLVAILVKHASMGSNCFHNGIGIESHVGADPVADPGCRLN